MKKIAVERLKFIGLMWIGISVLMLYSLPHHHHGEQPFLAHLCTSDCEHTTDHPEKGFHPLRVIMSARDIVQLRLRLLFSPIVGI